MQNMKLNYLTEYRQDNHRILLFYLNDYVEMEYLRTQRGKQSVE